MIRWVVVLALAACEKDGSKCKVEAKALGEFLAEMPREGALFQDQKGLELVARSDVRVTRMPLAPVVIMTAEWTSYQGMLVGDIEGLRERLDASHRQIVDQLERAPDREIDAARIYFQIDRRVPWSRVVEAVDVAAAVGFTAPGFPFAGTKLVPPPRTAIDDELDALEKGAAAANLNKLSDLVRRTIEPCEPLAQAFRRLAASTNRPDLFGDIAPALIECNCTPDPATVRSILWRVFSSQPTPILAFDSTPRDKTLSLPGTTTWAEASKQIPASSKGLRLVVK